MTEKKQSQKKGPAKPGPGRPKGVPNRTTTLLKDALLLAAENAGNKMGNNGLVSYLETQAELNPAPFMSLLGKVLPMQVIADMNVTTMTKEQRDAAVAAASRADS